MDCRDAERFVQLRLDGEIESADCMSLDRHLESCPHCRCRVEQERTFKSALRSKLQEAMGAPDARAPQDLKLRILSKAHSDDRGRAFPLARLIGAGLAIAVLGALSWSATSDEANILEETVARHSSNLPPEVRARANDEEPEVHRFLEQNLHYPVAVPRFGKSDLPVRLVGARLSNIRDRDAAYVMYDHRGAKLSLFAVPVPAKGARAFESAEGFERRAVGDKVLLVGQRRGYNVVSWRDRDLMYSLVSDVDPSELVQLVSSTSSK